MRGGGAPHVGRGAAYSNPQPVAALRPVHLTVCTAGCTLLCSEVLGEERKRLLAAIAAEEQALASKAAADSVSRQDAHAAASTDTATDVTAAMDDVQPAAVVGCEPATALASAAAAAGAEGDSVDDAAAGPADVAIACVEPAAISSATVDAAAGGLDSLDAFMDTMETQTEINKVRGAEGRQSHRPRYRQGAGAVLCGGRWRCGAR